MEEIFDNLLSDLEFALILCDYNSEIEISKLLNRLVAIESKILIAPKKLFIKFYDEIIPHYNWLVDLSTLPDDVKKELFF